MTYHLLVGLGNPGAQYARTRHNIGFMLMDELARTLGWEWKEEKRFLGQVAKGKLSNGELLLLLQPHTYMNESGRSVRKVLDFYKWTPSELLVVVDDVAIPFQEMRLKEGGSAGGHNGLKSLETHLGTRNYTRFRLGVGEQKRGDLSSHVLGRFSKSEEESLEKYLGQARTLIERLLKGEAFERVASEANRRLNNEKKAAEAAQEKTSE